MDEGYGNDRLPVGGFFNPMLGGGDPVGVFGGCTDATVAEDPWKVGSVSVGYTDGGGVERTRDVLTVYLPEGSLNIAGNELDVYDLAWGALDPVAAGDSVYYVLPSAQRSQLGNVWLNIYSLDDSGGETNGNTGQEPPSYKACISLTEAGPGAPSGYKLFTTIRICSVATEALDGTKISKLTQAVVGAIALNGGGGEGASGTITYIKAIRYDAASHQLQAVAETYDFATKQATALQVLPNPVNGWLMIPGGQAERAPICECNTGSGDSSGTGSGS